MMELVGCGVAAAGVVSAAGALHLQPGRSRRSIMRPAARRTTCVGLPGAYISDLLLQTFGLAIVLVPVALITWGVRMAAHPSSRLLRPAAVAAPAGAPDDERGLHRPGRRRRRGDPCRSGRAGRPGAGRPLPRDRAHPFERRQPGADRAGLRRARLHRHGAGARHEPHRPAVDLPHPARALPVGRLADAGRRRPVARQAAVVRRGVRPAGAGHRLCRDPGRDRRQPVRSRPLRDRFEQIPGRARRCRRATR